MAGLEELDLTKPGKIWATPEFETTTTFYMVEPKEENTKPKLIQSAQPPPAGDQLMPPFPVAHGALDKEGRAVLDLQKSGRAKNLMDKLEEKLKADKPLHGIRAVIMADAAPGNHIPEKVAVEVLDFSVAVFPIITLVAKRVKATAGEVKLGQAKAFEAEFRGTLPMKELKISIEPAVEFEINGQKFNGSTTMAIKDGQAYPIKVPISVDKGKVTLLTDAQKADFNYFLGLGDNLISRAGAKLVNPLENIDPALVKAGGLFPVTVNQRLAARRPVYDHRHPSSSWRQQAPYMPWTWNGKSGSYQIYEYNGYLDIETAENWAKRDFVLKVEGTGPYASTMKTLPLTLDGWGIDFHFDNLPRVFNHNAC